MNPVIIAMSLALGLTAYTIMDNYAEFVSPSQDALIQQHQETDITDTGVGCIDDCLDPMED